jgi:outer membrane lipoprotein carrier protein
LNRFARYHSNTHRIAGIIFMRLAVLSLLFAPIVAFAAPSDDLRALTKDLRALSGEFSQATLDAAGNPMKTLSGSFSIAKGGKFRFDYVKPYKQVLVSDGAKFSTYDADLAQMTVRKLDQSLAATPLAVLSGSAAIDSVFTLKESPDADGLQWVTTVSKQADAAVSDLRFGLSSGNLKALMWTDNFGKRTLMKFNTLTRNGAVNDATFAFSPPAGTEIVGQ